MKLKDLTWILAPGILYLMRYLASVNTMLVIFGALPLLIAIGFYFPNVRSFFKGTYGLINLFLLSLMIYSVLNSFTRSLIVFFIMMLYPHAIIGTENVSLDRLNTLAKQFGLGILGIFMFAIFIPLITSYPYSIGAWYFIASDEVATISSTLDGPFLLIIIVIYTLYIIKNNYKNISYIVFGFVILAFALYTILVFNRRIVLAVYLLFLPLIFFGIHKNNKFYFGIFFGTFLIPLFFGAILSFAGDILSIPFIKEFTLRTRDLDPARNQRLIGWIYAVTEFQSASLSDFFGFQKELIRSNIDRYNHFHNGYIQIFYEQGIFGFSILIMLSIQLLRRLKYFLYIDFNRYKYITIFPVIFGVIMLISITESTYQRLSVANLIFIFTAFMILKTSESIKNNLPS